VRAPHSHSWGGYQYHNAAIIGLDFNSQQVCVIVVLFSLLCRRQLRGGDQDSECSIPVLFPSPVELAKSMELWWVSSATYDEMAGTEGLAQCASRPFM